jgi:hypothetical protein
LVAANKVVKGRGHGLVARGRHARPAAKPVKASSAAKPTAKPAPKTAARPGKKKTASK